MKITRVDPFTQKENTLDLNVTEEQLQAWHDGALIQNVMPHLSADEREFIMTGLMPESWEEIFKGHDEAPEGEDIHPEDEVPY